MTEEKKPSCGCKLTQIMANDECSPAPAGLGKLYFTTAEDKNLEHLQEVELKGHRIDFKDIDIEDDSKNHWGDNDGNGWAVTATARLDLPEGEKQARRIWKQLTEGEGRLPRKEKKRRINRIMRNERDLTGLILLTIVNPMQVRDMVAYLLFPECIGRAEGYNVPVVCLKNPAQTHLIHLFTKRITKNNVKLLKRLWSRDHRHLAFEELLKSVEQQMKEIKDLNG